MKTIRNIAVVMLFSGAALASSHREAPSIANDPAADNTDVYAFVTSSQGAPNSNDTLNIVANWIPFEEPSGGPNFFKWSDDVQYQIHITQGTGPIKDNVVYTFYFETAAITPIADLTLLKNTCPTADSNPVGCIGGGKEFFAQLTGPTTGGAIVQTYTVTKSVNGVDQVPLTNTKAGFGGAFISVPANIGPRTQAILHNVAPTLVSSATYDDTFAGGFIGTTAAADGTRVFAGPRDDGFYADLGGIFDLANLRPRATAGACKPANDGVAPGTPKCLVAQDGLAGYNVHSIALEIPTKQLTSNGALPTVGPASDANTIGIWATSSRRRVSVNRGNGVTSSFGPWVQVSRLGLPLINEAVIGYQDKDKYNRTKPVADVPNFGAYILNPVIVPDYEAACAASTALNVAGACTFKATEKLRHGRTDIVDIISLAATGCKTYDGVTPANNCHHVTLTDGSTGDVLRVDLNLNPATYGFPNGRSLVNPTDPRKEGVDVTDVELSLLLGGVAALGANGDNGGPPAIQDHVEYNDKKFLTQFPWLALPWEGYSEGHGRGTP